MLARTALAVTIMAAAGFARPVSVRQSPQAAQTPTFKTGVDLIAVDVQVVDKNGQPVDKLVADQFEVSIDGHRRRVVTVDSFSQGIAAPSVLASSPGPTDSTARATPTPAEARRKYVIGVDEQSFRPGNARATMVAADRFISRLSPDDLVALYAYPTGAIHTELTTDHAAVRQALNKVMGLLSPPMTRFNLTVAEVVDINARDLQALDQVVKRECSPTDRVCRDAVRMEAAALAVQFEMQVTQSLGGLSGLVRDLSRVPGRKTLVIVSGGLFATDRAGSRPDMTAMTLAVGREAAAANVNLYVLHMDTTFLDAFSADGSKNTSTLFRDSNMLAQGLDLIAGSSGGALFHVQAGTGDSAFDRVLRETSAYYLLGVETTDAERDGSPHAIRVKVKRGGTTVRGRRTVVIPRATK